MIPFETMSPTRLFLHCAIPSMISMAVTSLYTIADGIFVGRMIGQEALAAVNLVMPLVMIWFALADMVAVGSSVRISILLGQGEGEQASLTFSFCLKVIALFSCATGLLGFFLAEPILLLMGAEAQVARLATEYIRVYALFAPMVSAFFAVDNYLRVCGKTRYSMVLNVLTALLNIVLDAVFLVALRRGVWAAALASCLSLSLGTGLSLLPFLKKKLALSFVRGNLSAREFARLLTNGSSELFTNVASSLMMLILNAVLLRLGGSVAVAAISVVFYVDSIVNSMIFGLADSMQPALSYCYGRGLHRRVRALEKRVLLAAAGVSTGALVLMKAAGGMADSAVCTGGGRRSADDEPAGYGAVRPILPGQLGGRLPQFLPHGVGPPGEISGRLALRYAGGSPYNAEHSGAGLGAGRGVVYAPGGGERQRRGGPVGHPLHAQRAGGRSACSGGILKNKMWGGPTDRSSPREVLGYSMPKMAIPTPAIKITVYWARVSFSLRKRRLHSRETMQ